MSNQDEKYMKHALSLACKGSGLTFTNPLVGCVIVKDDVVLAEGYHSIYGGDHAEIDALKKIDFMAQGATVYVNLEPCSHFGKTPPCAEALVKAGVAKVVIAMQDPNPKVCGSGVAFLEEAGVLVTENILNDEALNLNERFVKWITTGLPFIFVKSAITLDGFMSNDRGIQTPLGSLESMEFVHELREEYDAIAVGVGTVLIDDPKLTCRKPAAKRNPLRVVFDSELKIPKGAALLNEAGDVVVFCSKTADQGKRDLLLSTYQNLRIVEISQDGISNLDLKEAMCYLGKNDICSIMIEGGSQLVASFFTEKLVDKFSLIITPKIAVSSNAPAFFSENFPNVSFKKQSWQIHGQDAWFTAYLV